MLTLQAILLTSSLLMIGAMVGSVMFLATLRARIQPEAVPVESADLPL
jgi:hypoxanthine-guanine phosphoribosyltransferase